MRSIANCVERYHFTQDKFQSFTCLMLLLGAIFAMVPPIIVVLLEQSHSEICTQFVVYAHYSTHEWLKDKFNQFKNEKHSSFSNVCYELRIGDSALPDDVKPAIWIPETFVWIDIAQEKFRQADPDHDDLINDRDTDCTPTTSTPFGIITWAKFAEILSPDGAPIDFSTINIDILAPVLNSSDHSGEQQLHIAHGHPNVTSGGLLGFVTAFNALNTKQFPDFKTTKYTFDGCKASTENATQQMKLLEYYVISTTPIDYTLPYNYMMKRGPDYLHMAFGFENDVAALNNKSKSDLLEKWDDYLAFLYLSETYRIEHPMCKLTGAEWYGSDTAKVADAFITWITSDCADCIADLQNHGFRPFGVTVTNSSIISKANGCNLEADLKTYGNPPAVGTSTCVRQQFRTVKKHTRITVLLDVSGNMREPISSQETRWAAIIGSLPVLGENLEDSAQINLRCFHSVTMDCSPGSYPSGTLSASRSELEDYFASIAPQGDDQVNLFSSLMETYNDVVTEQDEQMEEFRYIILVISEDATTWENNATLLNLVHSQSDEKGPLQIRIFPILYFGTEDEGTYDTLNELAYLTGGEFSTADDNNLKSIITEFTYYW